MGGCPKRILVLFFRQALTSAATDPWELTSYIQLKKWLIAHGASQDELVAARGLQGMQQLLPAYGFPEPQAGSSELITQGDPSGGTKAGRSEGGRGEKGGAKKPPVHVEVSVRVRPRVAGS